MNPGIALCSLVRVWTIESISSSRVLSIGIDGDFNRWNLFSGVAIVSSLAKCRNIPWCSVDRPGGGRENPRLGGDSGIPEEADEAYEYVPLVGRDEYSLHLVCVPYRVVYPPYPP